MINNKRKVLVGTNPVDLRALPYRTRLIAEKVGINKAFVLLQNFAHKTLYVPGHLQVSSLAQTIGEEEAKALVELWPNTLITLPKVDKLLIQWRNHEILNALASNKLSTLEVCVKYDLTRQRINQIQREHETKRLEGTTAQNKNLTLDLSL